ncbi:hypothetical protein QA612_14605 [Evansella sp. AB-P1]|uniref:hypothetical protein n=1 Tax=Evansella sp. AB-P1 TaxID=3037653 RepID=UPI00241FE238|nr:hypothetical protein [Evansella sp. AB-P1]MDG5788708.1 hypothetical protein [Evansella sp. AB-P1]
MTSFSDSLVKISIQSDWLIILFLLIVGGIFWTIHMRLGFQVLYLTLLSMSIAHIITLYFPYMYTNDELLPITQPNVQTTMTLFAFFIPLARSRLHVLLCLTPPVLMSLLLVILTETHIFSIIGGILIGGFIIYTFYRTLDWIGAMPEPYLFVSAILFPLFLAAIIFPSELYLIYPGILLGSGIGVALEVFKVRMKISKTSILKRTGAFLIGALGIILFFGTDRFIQSWIPFTELTTGIVIGLWITFFVPILLILFKIYERKTKSRVF